MYTSIGPNGVVRCDDLIGVFDLDNVTWSHRTRKSLAVCEAQGCVTAVGEDLPRTMVLCMPRSARRRRNKTGEHAPKMRVYLTQLSVSTVKKHVESGQI